MKISFPVTPEQEGLTVGEFLKKQRLSRRLIISLKQVDMGITRNGEHIRTIDRVSSGDIIEIQKDDDSLLEPNGSLSAEVIYDDEHTVIFSKPANMPMHPSHLHRNDTLGNLFAYLYPNLTFRAVNRLDRDTTGLCVVAKTAFAANALQGKTEKTYYALAEGIITENGRIDAPIARERESIITRCVRSDGQRAITDYEVIGTGKDCTLLKIKLETGRTHQIRVHMAYIGHPLVGDGLYGRDIGLYHQLHCGELTLPHPITGEIMHFEAGLPRIFSRILKGEFIWKK